MTTDYARLHTKQIDPIGYKGVATVLSCRRFYLSTPSPDRKSSRRQTLWRLSPVPVHQVQAARHVEARVDAVDLNLGCPQRIARKGNYGAFLLPNAELCERLIATMSR